MKKALRKSHEPLPVLIILFSFQLFSFMSIFYSIHLKNIEFIIISIATIFILWAPWLVQKWMHIEFTPAMKILILLLALSCALLGHVWKVYYSIQLWDKILHCYFGFLFAAFGYIIPQMADRKNGKNAPRGLCILSALMAVLTVSVIWEFIEFGCDTIFHMDMQNDYVVHRITSYNLGDIRKGEQKAIENITSVVVNGKDLGLGGYLDIGLYDTMYDMLAAAIGAAVFCLLCLIKKGKYIAFAIPEVLPWKKSEYLKVLAEKEKAYKNK